MATRMQQRRGTAAQWTSANPVLNAGEMGWESDTNKFKMGDGTNHWADLDYFIDSNSTVNPAFGTSIVFEGATADSYETVLQVTDPTADRTITLPNVTGTVITTGNLSDITNIGVFTSTITMEGSTANDFELTLSAGDPTADRTITFPDATGTVALTSDITTHANLTEAHGATGAVVGTTNTQTLTNKTLTSPVVTGLTLNDSSIVFEGATADAYETTLTVVDPTADITITLPNATTTLVGTDTAQTLSNKTLSNPTTTIINLTTVKEDTVTSLVVSGGDTLLLQDAAWGSGSYDYSESYPQYITIDAGSGGAGINGTYQISAIPSQSGSSITFIVVGSLTNGTYSSVPVTASTSSEITISSTEISYLDTVSSNIQTQLNAKASLSGATFTGAVSGTDLTLSGNLTVNGTTTNINSTNLVVEDKNIVLADVATPTDSTADGGGITLKGATDKTFNWVDATDSWTSSEHINLASGKSYSMNGTALKDVSETLANKTLASAIATTAFTLNATAELRLADTDSSHYVGFKAPGTVSANKIWTLPAADGTAGQVLSTDGSGTFSFSTPAAGAAFSELMLIGA